MRRFSRVERAQTILEARQICAPSPRAFVRWVLVKTDFSKLAWALAEGLLGISAAQIYWEVGQMVKVESHTRFLFCE